MTINVDTPEFNTLRRRLVAALLRVPGIESFEVRSGLLRGLAVSIQRSQTMAPADLNHIIVDLGRFGRMLDKGGTRPLVVIVENALELVPEAFELGATLKQLAKEVADLYDGDAQPKPIETDEIKPEALVFGIQNDNRLSFDFVLGAQRTARSIARLAVPRIFDGKRKGNTLVFGTGWLVAPGILITNHHVIEARSLRPPPLGLGENPADPADFTLQAESVEAWFDFHHEGRDCPKVMGASLLASSRALDFAVIELIDPDKRTEGRLPLPVIGSPTSFSLGDRLNIAQHSKGGPLQLAIRNNFYVREGKTKTLIQYQTDTEGGASGSPVCDDQWNVVALHHASVQVPEQAVPQEVLQGQPVRVRLLNEAITLAAVIESLKKDFSTVYEKIPKPL